MWKLWKIIVFSLTTQHFNKSRKICARCFQDFESAKLEQALFSPVLQQISQVLLLRTQYFVRLAQNSGTGAEFCTPRTTIWPNGRLLLYLLVNRFYFPTPKSASLMINLFRRCPWTYRSKCSSRQKCLFSLYHKLISVHLRREAARGRQI